MDGFSKETYESSQVSGNWKPTNEQLLDYFIAFYFKNITAAIMVTPLHQNWWEMSDFVNWVDLQNIRIWFNSIIKPEDDRFGHYLLKSSRGVRHTQGGDNKTQTVVVQPRSL